MNTVYYVLIYLVGYVLSYLLIRKDFKNCNITWTQGCRLFALFCSLFSWFTILAGILIVYPISYAIRNLDKKVKW